MMNIFWALLGNTKVATLQPKPKAPMSDERLTTALKLFMHKSWNLKDATREAWGSIPKVKLRQSFMGCAYVDGRTEALKVNHRVQVTEADDDMDFSSYCVLVDGVPCLIIKRKGYDVNVTIIAERDFTSDVFGRAEMRMNTLEDFRALAEPVQKIMHDVLEKVLVVHERRVRGKIDSIEKMLTY